MSIIVDALKKAEEIKKRRQDEAKESASELRSLSSSTVTAAESKQEEMPGKQTEESIVPENIQEEPAIPEQVSFKETKNKITLRKPLIVLLSLVSVLVVCIFVFIFFGTIQWLDKINLANFSSVVSPSQKPPPAIVHTAPVTPPQQAPQAPTVTAGTAPASPAPPASTSEQPPVEKRAARSRKMPEFRLTGIYTMEGVSPYAFINGKVVKVGDTIMGAQVEIIKSDLVVLKYKNRDVVLTME